MLSPFSHESLSPDNSLVDLMDDFFSQAYSQQLEGRDPIGTAMGLLPGRLETISLNRRCSAHSGENTRFIISGASLSFNGFKMNIGNEDFEIKYGIVKITLAPDDKTPINELVLDELSMTSILFVDDIGRVTDGSDWLDHKDVAELKALMEQSELSPSIPSWAYQS